MLKENALFVGYKPMFMSSNRYLQRLKRRYGVAKAGYSGTLDPFAKGVLIIAFGNYTRLFDYLKQEPKVYRATLWLGLESDSLDIENVQKVEVIPPFSQERIQEVMRAFVGEVAYVPPKYSAKRLGGKRAYALARAGEDVLLSPTTMRIDSLTLLDYIHPFVTFEVQVGKGSYIRSLGGLIAEKLGVSGALSSLERVREGAFTFEQFRPLDPLEILDGYQRLELPHLREDFHQGKKLDRELLGNIDEGRYVVEFRDFFSIIEATENQVKYLLNRMEKC